MWVKALIIKHLHMLKSMRKERKRENGIKMPALYELVYQKCLWIYRKLYTFKIYHHTGKADLIVILAINHSHPYLLKYAAKDLEYLYSLPLSLCARARVSSKYVDSVKKCRPVVAFSVLHAPQEAAIRLCKEIAS